MPFDKSRYPENWTEFSLRIRVERAGNRCEWCNAENGKPHPVTGAIVVLTVAHLDALGDICQCEAKTGQKCMTDCHVVALCQREHLRYDARRHSFNARRTRARNAGQQWLGDIEHRYASDTREM